MIDTHVHLHFPQLAVDIPAVLSRATEAGVHQLINVASDLAGAEASIALAEQYPQIYATVGIHPHDAEKFEQWEKLEQLLQQPKVVAVGEIGLDYCKNYCPVDRQKAVFERQLFLAIQYQKPIIIHNRDADQDVFDYVAQLDYTRIVYHCFSSDRKYAQKLLTKGYMLSFTANITYAKNTELREVIKEVPLERILTETDSPFLAPQSLRGKINEPANVKSVVQCIADIKGISFAEVAKVTKQNAQKFFNI